MKSYKFLAGIIAVMAIVLMSFTTTGDRYPYGERSAVTLTYAGTVTVNPGNLSLTYAKMTVTGNVTVAVTTTKSIVGDVLILQLTANSSNRQVTWSTGMTAVNDSVVANKTKLFEFIYNGTAFVQKSEIQIN